MELENLSNFQDISSQPYHSGNLYETDHLWCAWFVGFVDGEGYFQLSPNNNHFLLSLTVRVRLDDESVLREVIDKLLVGKLNPVSSAHARLSGMNRSDQISWRCTKIREITKVLIPLFDSCHLKTKKQREYILWREAAILIKNKHHFTTIGHEHIQGLMSQMKCIRDVDILENK